VLILSYIETALPLLLLALLGCSVFCCMPWLMRVLNIEAATLDVYDRKHNAIYTGNVIAKQGEFVVRTELMTAFYTGETGLAGAIAAVTAAIGTDTLREAPSCSHGHRIWREGVSAKTGKAWANYSCVERKPNQCEPVWYVMGSSGKWSAQL
jgi:hypothetical protein